MQRIYYCYGNGGYEFYTEENIAHIAKLDQSSIGKDSKPLYLTPNGTHLTSFLIVTDEVYSQFLRMRELNSMLQFMAENTAAYDRENTRKGG